MSAPAARQFTATGKQDGRALNAFFHRLHREGYTADYRLKNLRNFRTQPKVADILMEDEIAPMLSACDLRTHWGARPRDADDAARHRSADERAHRAAVARYDLDGGALKVLGRGNTERIAPFGAAAQETMWRYSHDVRPEPQRTDCVFLTLDGTPFATRYLINCGDVFSLQQILGHTTLAMMRRYVRLASAHVAVHYRRMCGG